MDRSTEASPVLKERRIDHWLNMVTITAPGSHNFDGYSCARAESLAIPVGDKSFQFRLSGSSLRDVFMLETVLVGAVLVGTASVVTVAQGRRPVANELAELRIEFRRVAAGQEELLQDGAADVEVCAAVFGIRFKPVLCPSRIQDR